MSVAAKSKSTALELVTDAFVDFERSRKKERAALIAARNCGAKLIAAEKLCKHGEWLPLLNSVFEQSTRLAQTYMQIARHWDRCKNAATKGEALAMLREETKKPQLTPVAADILKACELVAPGLCDPWDWGKIEQNDHFVFKDGRIYTYNDEVSCSAPCEYANDLEIAVNADALRQVLRAVGDKVDTVELGIEDLLLSGPGVSAGVRMEETIQLPIDNVEPPTKWRPLPEGFDETVSLTVHCVSTDQSEFVNTCIHFHAEWTEACDNFQALRSDYTLGLKRPTLVRGKSIQNVIGHGMDEFSVTKRWIHFRSPDGLVMSCRRWTDEYPDYAPFINTKAKPLMLNSGVAAAARHAEIFSKHNSDVNQIRVTLTSGSATIFGEGAPGWLRETKPVGYEGKVLSFNISPSLLRELIKRAGDEPQCSVAPGVLKIPGAGWVYVACLGKIQEWQRE